MKLLLCLIAFLAPKVYAISPITTAHLIIPAEIVVSSTPNAPIGQIQPLNGIREYVVEQANDFGVNPNLATCIVTHESQWIPDKTGPEKIGASEGLWQIYLRMHPDIKKEQADDYKWATNWALTQIKNGHISWWSTFSAPPYYCSNLQVMLN